MASWVVGHLRLLVASRIGGESSASLLAIASQLQLERVRSRPDSSISCRSAFPFCLRYKKEKAISVASLNTCQTIKAVWQDLGQEHLCFAFCPHTFLNELLDAILDDKSDKEDGQRSLYKSPVFGAVDDTPCRMLIEFGSPNVAKKLHAGHLRSTLIGNTLANVGQKLGHNVIRMNWVGDWGSQFGILLAAMEDNKMATAKDEVSMNMATLSSLYISANRRAEEEADFRARALQLVAELEHQDDVATHPVYQRVRKITLEALEDVYKRLNVHFDVFNFESEYVGGLKERLIQLLEERNLLRTDQVGRKVVHLDNNNNNDEENHKKKREAVLVKSDGASLYLTRDLSAALDRHRTFNFDRMLYVVEQAQRDHFEQLFALLDLLTPSLRSKVELVNFGRVQGMSSRSGTGVEVDVMLDEAVKRVRQQRMESPNTRRASKDKMDDEEIDATLATSAIVLNVLKTPRRVNHKFKWEQALRSKGHYSAIRVQYTHCRLNSLLDISSSSIPSTSSLDSLLESEVALDLVLALATFDVSLKQSFEELEPNHLVMYIFRLCDLINAALKELRVKDEADLHKAEDRRKLFKAAQVVLADAMRVVGLQPLDQM